MEYIWHVKSNWSEGDIKKYRLTRKKIKLSSERVVSSKETIRYVVLEVLKCNPDSQLIKWTEYRESKRLISRLLNKFFGKGLDEVFSITYTTTESGVIEEFVDREDLDLQIKVLENQLEEVGNTNQEKKFIKESISNDIILASILKPLQIFHFPYDEEFSETGVVEYIHIKNPFMPDNELPCQIINSIFYFDESIMTGEVQIERKYDQVELNRRMKDTLTSIGARLEKNMSTKERFDPFVITEFFIYKIDLKTGWLFNGKYERVLISGEEEKTEVYEFTLEV